MTKNGRANLVRFNIFESIGAFTRDPATFTYQLAVLEGSG